MSGISSSQKRPRRFDLPGDINPLQLTSPLTGLGASGAFLSSKNIQSGIDKIRGKGPGRSQTDVEFAQRNPTILASDFNKFLTQGQSLASASGPLNVPQASAGATLQNISTGAPVVGQGRVDQLAAIFAARRADIQRRRRSPGRSQTILTANRRTALGA